ncbi:MAG: nitroreductase [Bacteroidales bacterium]|nr:nitroreductase [Bacteroidales bacterium]
MRNSDFRFMIEQAIKAPSGHNTQPWLFRENENRIEIYPNFTKALPVVDPDNRELFISLGCATENFCIAASEKGYASNVSINDQGVIAIKLIKSASSLPDPLFAQIAIRQTNRNVYNGRIIPEDTINILKEITPEAGVSQHVYKNGTMEYTTISDYVRRGNTLQMQDKAFIAELHSWMRYNKKHQDKYNDGLSYAVFGAPNLPLFIVKPIMKQAVNEKSQNKGDMKKIQSSSHFVLFTTQNNTEEGWINLGRTLERFLLQSTGLGIAHAHLNQPNEIRELSVEMTETLGLSDENPLILLRIGYGERVPYSKRKNIEEVIL